MQRLFNSQIWQFFVFLLTPEDSSTGGYSQYRDTRAFLNNRICGAIKIVFWISVAVAFWSFLPLLCRVFTAD